MKESCLNDLESFEILFESYYDTNKFEEESFNFYFSKVKLLKIT